MNVSPPPRARILHTSVIFRMEQIDRPWRGVGWELTRPKPAELT